MKKFYVYIHTCKANGKKYVGITTKVKPELRWGKNGEGYLYNDHFRSAILKHGWNNFEHEVFEVDSAEEMYRKEVELISFYHSNDPEYGYNNSVGGEHGYLGCKHSEEYRKKMSESQKEKWTDPEFREKMSEVYKEKWTDPEFREKMSKALKGKTRSEEAKRRMAEVRKEKWTDPGYREKVLETMKKVHSDPEYRKRISETLKSKPHKPFSEEHRQHLAEANRRKAKDPEIRRKQSEGQKGKPKPKIKIQLSDGTVLEITKQNLVKWYINKGKSFEYVS